MPKLNPGVLEHRLNCPLTTSLFDETLEHIRTLKEIYGQDPFKNALMYEIGTASVLRRFGYEDTFDLTAGMFGCDAEAPGSGLKAIEIKGASYKVKTWKIPDVMANPSLQISFDNRSFLFDDSKLDNNDGYAFGLFGTNYDFPDWVELHNYEPIVLFWIPTPSGVAKITKILKVRNAEILKRLEEEAKLTGIPVDQNTHKNSRIRISFNEVFEMMTNKELWIIVNGRRLTKAQYEQAIQMGDEFWLKELWKKEPSNKNKS